MGFIFGAFSKAKALADGINTAKEVLKSAGLGDVDVKLGLLKDCEKGDEVKLVLIFDNLPDDIESMGASVAQMLGQEVVRIEACKKEG